MQTGMEDRSIMLSRFRFLACCRLRATGSGDSTAMTELRVSMKSLGLKVKPPPPSFIILAAVVLLSNVESTQRDPHKGGIGTRDDGLLQDMIGVHASFVSSRSRSLGRGGQESVRCQPLLKKLLVR